MLALYDDDPLLLLLPIEVNIHFLTKLIAMLVMRGGEVGGGGGGRGFTFS